MGVISARMPKPRLVVAPMIWWHATIVATDFPSQINLGTQAHRRALPAL